MSAHHKPVSEKLPGDENYNLNDETDIDQECSEQYNYMLQFAAGIGFKWYAKREVIWNAARDLTQNPEELTGQILNLETGKKGRREYDDILSSYKTLQAEFDSRDAKNRRSAQKEAIKKGEDPQAITFTRTQSITARHPLGRKKVTIQRTELDRTKASLEITEGFHKEANRFNFEGKIKTARELYGIPEGQMEEYRNQVLKRVKEKGQTWSGALKEEGRLQMLKQIAGDENLDPKQRKNKAKESQKGFKEKEKSLNDVFKNVDLQTASSLNEWKIRGQKSLESILKGEKELPNGLEEYKRFIENEIKQISNPTEQEAGVLVNEENTAEQKKQHESEILNQGFSEVDSRMATEIMRDDREKEDRVGVLSKEKKKEEIKDAQNGVKDLSQGYNETAGNFADEIMGYDLGENVQPDGAAGQPQAQPSLEKTADNTQKSFLSNLKSLFSNLSKSFSNLTKSITKGLKSLAPLAKNLLRLGAGLLSGGTALLADLLRRIGTKILKNLMKNLFGINLELDPVKIIIAIIAIIVVIPFIPILLGSSKFIPNYGEGEIVKITKGENSILWTQFKNKYLETAVITDPQIGP